MTQTQSSNPATETAAALTDLCARTAILETKMQQNIDETINISSKVKKLMEMMQDFQSRLEDVGFIPHRADKQLTDFGSPSALLPTPTSSIMSHVSTGPLQHHEVLNNRIIDSTNATQTILDESTTIEVTLKPIPHNLLLSLLPSKKISAEKENLVSKSQFVALNCFDNLCTEGVRQNAYESLSSVLPPEKPPDEYLNMVKMLKANNVRSAHLKAMEIARESGAFLSSDPNQRIPLWPSVEEARKQIMSIWNQADNINVSDNELEFLTGSDKIDDASKFLNDKVTKAIVTVPAYFNDSQRTATKDARKIAGLEVLRIINEPTAASLAYGFEQKNNETLLVFDLGGGTFEVSVLEVGDGVFEVLSTSGDTHLGGGDFDKRVVDWLSDDYKRNEGIDLLKDNQALQRLTETVEKAKMELSSLTQTNISLPSITATTDGPKHIEMAITRAKFEELCSYLLDRLRTPDENSLRDAKLSFKDLDEVILVGGSTRISAEQELVRKLTGKDPNVTVNPDEVVALGAAVQAGVLSGDVSDIVLLDVTPLFLGLETFGGVMTKIIPRNTTLPTSKLEVSSTAADGQTSVEINVLHGEREFVRDNKSIGSLSLDGIPPVPRGVPQIEVKFDIDANGILSVTAVDKGTSKKQDITITGASTLPSDEVEKMVNEAEDCYILTCNASLEYDKSEVHVRFVYSNAEQREKITGEFLNKAVKPVLVGGQKLRVAKTQKVFENLADMCEAVAFSVIVFLVAMVVVCLRTCRGVIAHLQLSGVARDGNIGESPSILSDVWPAVQNSHSLYMGATWDWKSLNYSRDVSSEEASSALEELLPKASTIYPNIKNWEFNGAVAGVRAMPPLTVKNGSLLLLGCLDNLVSGNGNHGTKFWLFCGLGSRGLLYHAMLGKITAKAVLACDENLTSFEPQSWNK